MNNLPAAVYGAMAKQVKRTRRDQTPQEIIDDLQVKLAQVERERDNALEEVKRLNEENDKLALKAHRTRKTNGSTGRLSIDGREVVNQVEAAEILKVPQWKISRWVAAGKFEKVAVPGRKKPMLFADSLTKPEPGKPGRKKN